MPKFGIKYSCSTFYFYKSVWHLGIAQDSILCQKGKCWHGQLLSGVELLGSGGSTLSMQAQLLGKVLINEDVAAFRLRKGTITSADTDAHQHSPRKIKATAQLLVHSKPTPMLLTSSSIAHTADYKHILACA